MQQLYVLGPQKSGTSSMVGILNSHPEIFCMYEVNLNQPIMKRYGKQLINALPNSLRYFNEYGTLEKNINQLFNEIQKSKFESQYKYFGDKIITLNPFLNLNHEESKTIFMIRDITTWLCKEKIKESYGSSKDIINPSVQYFKFLANSFNVKRSIRIKMEDMIINGDIVLEKLEFFLNLDGEKFPRDWYQKLDKHSPRSLKYYLTWYDCHLSSKEHSKKLDLEVEINKNKFWDEFLPLFYKYFNNLDSSFSSEEINNDIKKADSFKKIYPVIPLEKAFKVISSKKIYKDKSILQKVNYKFNRLYRNLINN